MLNVINSDLGKFDNQRRSHCADFMLRIRTAVKLKVRIIQAKWSTRDPIEMLEGMRTGCSSKRVMTSRTLQAV